MLLGMLYLVEKAFTAGALLVWQSPKLFSALGYISAFVGLLVLVQGAVRALSRK